MADRFNANTVNEDKWFTPPSLVKSLGGFDLDPCFLPDDIRPWDLATKHYSTVENGLVMPWEGRVWCNPPYGRETHKWISKLSNHGNGVALVFARTDTQLFHQHIFPTATGLFFIEGRIRFINHKTLQPDTYANAPSVLVAYGASNFEACLASGTKGHGVRLRA